MKILEQQDTGTCTKTLKIEVPRDEVEGELQDVYKEFMQHAQVPGFRKGKAPRHIVKMRYGKLLDKEAVGKAIEEAFKEATKELNLDPVTQPDLGDFDPETTDDPIVFEAKFEYRPDIELAEYKDIRPEPPSTDVTENEIVETLNQIRERNATFQTIDDRPASENDHVNISSSATIDGEVFQEASHNDIVVEVGTNRYIPGFEDQIIGMDPGDEKEFTLTLPDNYPMEERRGKEAHFKVQVKQIREKILPELDDEFAKDMGNFETLNELKEHIRQDMLRRREGSKEEAIRQGIRQELLQRNQFDVPPSMVKAQYNYINAVQDMEYRRMGQSLERMAKQDEGLLARNEQAAEEEVRLSIILSKIAQKEDIEITDEEYEAYIYRMAQAAQGDPAMYKERIESQGMESHYRRLALEDKVLNYLHNLAERNLEHQDSDSDSESVEKAEETTESTEENTESEE